MDVRLSAPQGLQLPESITKQNKDERSKVLLIDLENCPSQINSLQQNLEHFSQVIICYAQTDATIPLDWLTPLSLVIGQGQLKIFKMTSSGKNAADFGICFYAGVLMQQLHPKTHFVIISDDRDLDHVINLLKSQGRSAERIGTHENEVDAQNTNSQSSSPPVKECCLHLITSDQNRPTKKDSLLNSIKNWFKSDSLLATELMQALIECGAIKISNKKVAYNEKKLKEIANHF